VQLSLLGYFLKDEWQMHKVRFWPEQDKLIAKKLKESGFTNREIAVRLNRSESSVSHFFQREGIKLPKDKRVGQRVKAVREQRQDNVRQIKENLKYNQDLGYIIGVLYGDGSCRVENTRGYIKLMAKDKSFVSAFSNCLEKCFKVKPKYHEYNFKSTGNVYDVTLYNKYLAIWLNDEFGPFDERNWFINPERFLTIGLPFCNGVIRGLFDSEGCVNHKGISIVSCNKRGLQSLAILISSVGVFIGGFGFEPKIFKKLGKSKWELRINKRQSKLFAESIGSSIDYKKAKFNKYLNTNLIIKGGWSHEEDKFLNEMILQRRCASEVAKILKRDKNAVYHRAKKLGIRFESKEKWSKELVIEKLKELYRKGEDLCPHNIRYSYGKLRGACESYFGSVSKALEAAGIPDNVLRRGRKPSPKEELEQLYLKDKLSTKEIGHQYGVSHKVVLRWLKEYNISIRSPHDKKIPDEQKGKVVQMYLSGVSRDKIGEKFNCGRETIRKILVNEGILDRVKNT
jgi:transposase